MTTKRGTRTGWWSSRKCGVKAIFTYPQAGLAFLVYNMKVKNVRKIANKKEN